MRPKVILAATLALPMGASAASAQTYTVYSVTSGSGGTVVAGSTGTTVFTIGNPTTISSGTGSLYAGPVNFGVLTINCTDGIGTTNSCASNAARVTVVRTGVNTGRAQTIRDISVISTGGSRTSGHDFDYAGGGGIDCTMSGWTAAGNQSLLIRMMLPVLGDDSSQATTATSQFRVAVAKTGSTPIGGVTGLMSVTVRRAVAIAKVSDLRFGTFIRPTTSTDYVAVDANSNRFLSDSSGNARQGTAILIPSAYGAAQFTIKGEPTTAISISVPSTFAMTGPGSALTVMLTPSATGSQTIPASGTLTLSSGGYFGVGSTQAAGSYSGSFNVTIAYN